MEELEDSIEDVLDELERMREAFDGDDADDADEAVGVVLGDRYQVTGLEDEGYACGSNVYDCGDFDSYEEALAVFEFCPQRDNSGDPRWD